MGQAALGLGSYRVSTLAIAVVAGGATAIDLASLPVARGVSELEAHVNRNGVPVSLTLRA